MATNVVPLLLMGMAGTPAIIMLEGLVRLLPLMVTRVPIGPAIAVNEVIIGAGINVNPASEAVPPGVVRLTAPLLPAPTIATIDVEETTVKEVTAVPPSVMADVLVKLVPVMLMMAPVAAIVGVNEVMVGEAIKVNPVSEAFPPGVVRLTAPEEPLPTTAIIEVLETTVKEVTGVPPNEIA
jgi:hypothetical protein